MNPNKRHRRTHLIVLLLGLLITPMLSPVNDCTSLADVAFLQDA